MFVEEKECKGRGRGMATATATATAASMEVGPWVGRPSSLSRTQETGGGGKARPRKDPRFLLPQYKICIVYLVSLPLSSSRPFLDSTTRYITRRQGGRERGREGAETRPQLPLLSSLGDFGSRGLRGDEREKERPLNSRKAPPSPSFSATSHPRWFFAKVDRPLFVLPYSPPFPPQVGVSNKLPLFMPLLPRPPAPFPLSALFWGVCRKGRERRGGSWVVVS